MSRSASTPSDPWQGEADPWASSGPPPAWLGDVTSGVEAWTRGTGDTADRPAADRSRRSGDRTGRAKSGSRGRAGRAQPAPAAAPTDEEARGRKILLDQLTAQARSRRQLADKLAQREIPDEIATALLDRFEEVGLIDDAAFARAWVSGRQSGKGLARRALAQELRRKGVSDEVARAALDELDPDDEREAGRALVRKKLRTMHRLDQQVKVRRLVGMLARKGYSPGVAYAIVREEVDADPDEGMLESGL
ncbi:regulatory protein RecX [Nocardioides insulae]|uniref:regulatory protein RecX n=1 Tax=Nocardioides insulae TaxID=394734 RepID=UPI00041E2DFE